MSDGDQGIQIAAGGIANADIARRVAEVQGEIAIAQSFPRNEQKCLEKIIKECGSNKALAEMSLYAYPRGGQTVTGPSIRLAEVLCRHWGHIDTGIREISNSNGQTEMEAFAWDKQTNVRDSKRFFVKHERTTKKGTSKLTDQRDVYELGANLGSRRKRACILSIIPGYIVDQAVEACKKRLTSSDKPMSERIRSLVPAFGALNVSVDMIESRIGHSLDDLSQDELLDLSQIYNSLKDKMTKREDWFDLKREKTKELNEHMNEGLKTEKEKDDE